MDKIKGRGAAENPKNRFSKDEYARKDEEFPDAVWEDPEEAAPGTQFIKNDSRTLLNHFDSPDLGKGVSLNPYRGCEHGCVYCYARPTHEYFGMSAGLDFETKIFVKEDAPVFLRRELSSEKWRPQVIMFSGITDVYQPAERRFQLTRRCLEVLAEFRNPAAMITKNYLVTRDIDILKKLAVYNAVSVTISVTTLDGSLSRVMEPRASHPKRRLEAIRELAQAGIRVGVNVAPIIPGLTDHEMPMILKAAAEAGASHAGYTVVRLPYGVKDLFQGWLSRHFPDRKAKVLSRIRALRDGQLNDARPYSRMRGEGLFAEQIQTLFEAGYRRAGFKDRGPGLSTAAFRRSADLFDGVCQ